MKKLNILATLALVLMGAALLSLTHYKKPAGAPNIKPAAPAPITMCGALLTDWTDTAYTQTKLLPGLGNLHYRITTRSAEAQAFFEQGLRLVYAFNHWEAIQAFREATRPDAECAMAYWGLALAYGPNLNDVNPADREKIAFESIRKAVNKKAGVSAVERGLIDALALRYDGKAHAVRDTLNSAYATAMVALAKQYQNDAEVQTLCADAIMNTMPWDYWQKDGTPKPETIEAKAILETALKKFPQHPGAHHLYIHLVEASSQPEQALASAQFLETAMPGAGHLVHMPAHIYVRVGQYDRSVTLNQRAVMVDEEYLSRSANRGMYRYMLYPHNVDFISFSAFMEGKSDLAIRTAVELGYKGSLITSTIPAFGEYFAVQPMHAYVRFGRWRDVLSLPEPDNDLIYAQLIARFARGMALVRTASVAEAVPELAKLDSLCSLDTLKSVYFSFNPASSIVQVPLHLLRGELLIRQNKVADGIEALRKAVAAEDGLRYNEPPDWKIPARQFLGAALYDAGRYSEAAEVYLQDLKIYRENGWSLKGLQLCQEKLGKKTEAAATAKRFASAWKLADVELKASRY